MIDSLTAEEQQRVNQLSVAEIRAIDNGLIDGASSHWRKVARVVGIALNTLRDGIPAVPDAYYAQRVRHLVAIKRLESQGTLAFMRFSEVRLPQNRR